MAPGPQLKRNLPEDELFVPHILSSVEGSDDLDGVRKRSLERDLHKSPSLSPSLRAPLPTTTVLGKFQFTERLPSKDVHPFSCCSSASSFGEHITLTSSKFLELPVYLLTSEDIGGR